MAFAKRSVDPNVQFRLREMAAEMRELLYGAAGCPGPWGHWAGLKLRCDFAQIVRITGFDLF
jgi:hypothetical protein